MRSMGNRFSSMGSMGNRFSLMGIYGSSTRAYWYFTFAWPFVPFLAKVQAQYLHMKTRGFYAIVDWRCWSSEDSEDPLLYLMNLAKIQHRSSPPYLLNFLKAITYKKQRHWNFHKCKTWKKLNMTFRNDWTLFLLNLIRLTRFVRFGGTSRRPFKVFCKMGSILQILQVL